MSSRLRIRRSRSVLADGTLFGHHRRGLTMWKLGLWLLAMGFLGLVVWQFNVIQSQINRFIGTSPTATPPAVAYAQAGNLAFVRGDLDTAIVNYRQAVLQAPDNIDMLYELIRMLIYRSYSERQNSHYKTEALQLADQAVQKNPRNARAYTIHCFALLTADNREEDAVRACLKAIQLNPKDADAHAYLAATYYSLLRVDAALDEARLAVELNDQSIDAHTQYAFVLHYKGKDTNAMEHIKRAAEINPQLEFPYFNMAYLAVSISQYEVAINAYNRILTLNPSSAKAYVRLCETYYRMGETDRALDNCKTAINLDNQYTVAYKWLGQVEYTRRDYEDAIDHFAVCAQQEESDPTLPKSARFTECWYLRGLAYYYLDKCDRAMAIFNDLLAWTTEPTAIEKTNIGIYNCGVKHQGQYPTPTPIPPTPTLEPLIQ